jgi:hypothetical protein
MKSGLIFILLYLTALASNSQGIKNQLVTSYTYSYTSLKDSTLENWTTRIYDEHGKTTFEVGFLWNSGTNKWVGTGKTEYSYDSQGNKILIINYDWDPINNYWFFTYKEENSWDADGNKILSLSYRWNPGINDWNLTSKWEWFFDANGNQSSVVYSFWISTRMKFTVPINLSLSTT